jgi:hypothetical protein
MKQSVRPSIHCTLLTHAWCFTTRDSLYSPVVACLLLLQSAATTLLQRDTLSVQGRKCPTTKEPWWGHPASCSATSCAFAPRTTGAVAPLSKQQHSGKLPAWRPVLGCTFVADCSERALTMRGDARKRTRIEYATLHMSKLSRGVRPVRTQTFWKYRHIISTTFQETRCNETFGEWR